MTRDVTRRTGAVASVSPWQDDFEKVVRHFFGDADATLAGSFSPALDVEETDEAFTLHVELPGVNADDVDLSIEDNVLSVAGQRDFYNDKSAEGFRRVERRFGRFHRAIRLPDRVDADKISAQYRDGLLTVTVPKAESAKPRRIKVNAA